AISSAAETRLSCNPNRSASRNTSAHSSPTAVMLTSCSGLPIQVSAPPRRISEPVISALVRPVILEIPLNLFAEAHIEPRGAHQDQAQDEEGEDPAECFEIAQIIEEQLQDAQPKQAKAGESHDALLC